MKYINYLKLLIILVIIAVVWYQGYSYGTLSAQQQCAENNAKYQLALQNKIDAIESNLSTLATIGQQREEQLAQDISQILAGVKKKPVTVVKNGQCNPSATFLDGINQAIDRANSK